MSKTQDFSGVWHSVYHFTSSLRPGNFDSEYDLKITQKGDKVVMESLPNDQGSYMFLKLSLNGNIVTGTWQEQTSPKGFYKGITYEGAVQLAIDFDKKVMVGKWVTYGADNKVGSGDWEITKLPDGIDLAKHSKQHAVVV